MSTMREDAAVLLGPTDADTGSLDACAECGCKGWRVVTRGRFDLVDPPRVVALQCDDCGRSRPPLADRAERR